MKKKRLILAILVIALFAVFALGSSDSGTDDQGSQNANSNQGNLGDYNVDINGCRVAQDYEGKPVIIIQYTFKNVADDEAASFAWSISDKVYQNGVELEQAYSLDDSANYSSENQSTNIKMGASIEVEVAYELRDTTADVEVELEELISFSDKSVKKTFKLENVEMPEQGNLGKYSVEILSCRMAIDYEGKPVVIVKYSFENVSDSEAVAFIWKVSDKVYQNGIELEDAYFLDESAEYDSEKKSAEIQKGTKIEVEVAYVLKDTTSDINVEVSRLISLDETVIKKTLSIAAP